MRARILPVRTRFWRPGTNPTGEIVQSLPKILRNGDFVVVSEKAICTAAGSIFDESYVNPCSLSRFLARIWMRIVWGYFLGPLTRLNYRNIQRIRDYPLEEGAAHKHVALRNAGFCQSLKHWSEGGIDTTNLPYRLSSLPLKEATQVASRIRGEIAASLGCSTNVVIADSDKTFSFRNFHFSTRKSKVPGIHNLGTMGFILGRFFRCKPRSTPIAYAGREVGSDLLLNVAALANKTRGCGAGRTVWDMAEAFDSSPTEVTWEMLDAVPHFPIVVVRLRGFSRPKPA